ncbi:23S rRNA (uracil(1939)-C(5))-methyltransferase RlmD [Lachnoanaerobaculum sp. Marseille-Q4761]|uniref:23S rRNA (uracil(1939)-C(5))-methyltransferase RlmD n=1 Tax=Lachnoanaerobaculum sp. Marseille-Q4761 TaxID=2819511 RepID=UPI001AA14FC6|nr:23S rRNA (uracil(1939)-C(5))-methyltransferase RlmD [Lachnoanaerobaculum sp. Marseille-Q4761]MBO1869675.1 23S rRNA (uracil(1939)-C(5))-methyltransferase RlmD [Lachnoanaerobaculum sp. Marseille-Q4761]
MKTDNALNYKKGEMITVDITDFGENGEGIGKTDAFTWFIKDTVIGDKVIAKVMKTKKSYGYARLDSIVKESPDRVKAKCPVARSCGGCKLQSLDYRAELRLKQNKVENHLKRIGGFDLSNVEIEEIIGMEEPYRYRNKSQFPFGRKNGKNITGYFAGRTHSIVEFDDCIIGIEENKAVLNTVLDFMDKYRVDAYNEEDGSGIVRHVLIRKGFATGELMVCVVINADNLSHNRELVKSLSRVLGDDLKSISININKKNTNVILGDRTFTIYGREYIEDYIGDVKFRISPQSFYQVNPVQTKKLYGKALEYAALTGEETVWDMYCGIGTISLFLAKSAKFVYGVEIVDAAIQNARENAMLNNIENVKFFVGKAEEIITGEYENGNIKDIDVIVVDPPRKGLDKLAIDTMLKLLPKRIVYVSCDSSTLARDLKMLCEKEYELKKLTVVDQFSRSYHTETVALLSKLDVDKHIDVEIKLDELDLTSAESKATYAQIKEYILEKFDLKVSTLYIAQIKKKCGIILREHYNKSKKEKQVIPQCTPEKEEAIMDALKHFKMI